MKNRNGGERRTTERKRGQRLRGNSFSPFSRQSFSWCRRYRGSSVRAFMRLQVEWRDSASTWQWTPSLRGHATASRRGGGEESRRKRRCRRSTEPKKFKDRRAWRRRRRDGMGARFKKDGLKAKERLEWFSQKSRRIEVGGGGGAQRGRPGWPLTRGHYRKGDYGCTKLSKR